MGVAPIFASNNLSNSLNEICYKSPSILHHNDVSGEKHPRVV